MNQDKTVEKGHKGKRPFSEDKGSIQRLSGRERFGVGGGAEPFGQRDMNDYTKKGVPSRRSSDPFGLY